MNSRHFLNKMKLSVLTSLLYLGLQSSDANSLESTHADNAYYVSQEQPHRDIAVLLIDMQKVYREDLSPSELEKEIPSQIAVLDYAQENGFPIIVIKYDTPFLRPYGIDLMDELAVELSVYETIHKKRTGGFRETPLDEMLKSYGVQEVVLMGTYASDCVWETGNGALINGYSIITSPDLILDPVRLKDWGLNESQDWYAQNGILFSNHDKVIDYMETKTHEQFLQCK